mgnify:CR=1 FL=1
MATRLTDRLLRSLGPEDAGSEFRDEKLTNLAARVGKGGKVTFSVTYRLGGRGSKRRRLTLGEFPALSLAEARNLAQRQLGEVAGGADPAAEREQFRRPSVGTTLAGVVTSWLEGVDGAQPTPWRAGWRAEQLRGLERDILPTFGNVHVAQLTRRELLACIDKVARRAPASANRIRKTLLQVFDWAVDRELLSINPLVRTKAPAPSSSGDRVLTDEEIVLAWRGIADYPKPMSLVLALELVTLQRGGEILSMRREDLDLANEWWTIPAERTKTKREPHRVPLNALALSILALASLPPEGLAFPGRGGRPMVKTAPAKAATRIVLRTGMTPWTPHDLRRTAATKLVDAGVEEWHVGLLLSHGSRHPSVSPVTRAYVRSTHDAPKRNAALTWDARAALLDWRTD